MTEMPQVTAGDIVDLARTAKEVLPQTITEADCAISTLVGWFNNVVLYPVKKANITYKYKLESFEEDLRKKLELVPAMKICEPKLSIVGPTLEALKYAYDEEALREMYVNLLASSMNCDVANRAHPSYVEVIKQMDSFDANLFSYLAGRSGNFAAINPRIEVVGSDKYLMSAAPEWFFEYDLPDCDIFELSISLVRLARIGLLTLHVERTIKKGNYEKLAKASALLTRLECVRKERPMDELTLNYSYSSFEINEFGINFAQTCL